MPLTDADILKLLTTKINASGTTVGVALEAAARAASLPTATDTTDALLGKWLGASGPTVAVAVQSTYGLVRELADRAGVDIDEAAFAAAVVSEIAPQVIAAVVAKLDGISGVDPAALAAEIVAELGSKLAA